MVRNAITDEGIPTRVVSRLVNPKPWGNDMILRTDNTGKNHARSAPNYQSFECRSLVSSIKRSSANHPEQTKQAYLGAYGYGKEKPRFRIQKAFKNLVALSIGSSPLKPLPVPARTTLSCAHFFSSSFKNPHDSIESGRMNSITTPHKPVASPNILHLVSTRNTRLG